MWNKIKFVWIIIIEQYQQIRDARREAAVQRQKDFVAQLGNAYDNHPFPDYWERYQRESDKLARIQRI